MHLPTEDERSIANRLEKEASKKGEDEDSDETKLHKLDATAPVRTSRPNLTNKHLLTLDVRPALTVTSHQRVPRSTRSFAKRRRLSSRRRVLSVPRTHRASLLWVSHTVRWYHARSA
jgi:hypothetical protein